MQEQAVNETVREAVVPNATQVVDLILFSLVKNKGTMIWFEPVIAEGQPLGHLVTFEKHRSRTLSLELQCDLGEASLARLAILAELDFLATGVQNGRLAILVDGRALDLLFTLRSIGGRHSGEIRVLNILGQEQDTVLRTPVSGQAYPAFLKPGTFVGPYRIENTLGRGGMGIVYLVEHTLLRKRFAMKILHGNTLERDPDAARRFVREGLAAARVRHDGIVDVSDFGSFTDGRHYLVMELLDNYSLYDLMDAPGGLQLDLALRLMRDVASALGAAHAAGVVHRDISPSNIFIRRVDGKKKIKIVDFGAASVPDRDQKDVPDGPPGMVIGTPHYMAPEQVQSLPMDARADMYSFGAVLYELVSGQVPFDGDNPQEIGLKHMLAPLPHLEDIDIPTELWTVLARLLEKDPDNRYATMAEVVTILDGILVMLRPKRLREWFAL